MRGQEIVKLLVNDIEYPLSVLADYKINLSNIIDIHGRIVDEPCSQLFCAVMIKIFEITLMLFNQGSMQRPELSASHF